MRVRLALGAVATLVTVLLVACGKVQPTTGILVPNERPVIRLSTLPEPGDSVYYIVRFTWFSFDPDGEVVRFRYAIDPPIEGDTAWVETVDRSLTQKFSASVPGPPGVGGVLGSQYHAFVIEAIDDQGAPSLPASDAFVSTTVAPTARITVPTPNRLTVAATATSVTFQWIGTDPDGSGDKKPVKYKVRLEDQQTIQRALGIGTVTPNPTELSTYFSQEAPGYASWDSVSAESTFRRYEGLNPGQIYYFAVIAIDEAGAYDPRFDLDRNLIRFRPSSERFAPKLTVTNDLVIATSASMDVSEARVFHIAIPAATTVRFDWSAEPPPGGEISAYRWILDPVNGDISDETPRDNESQTYRWSSWALESRSATLGPFPGNPALDELHRFYVECRGNSGFQSIVAIEIRVVYQSRPLLVIDDVLGPPDLDFGPSNPYSYQPYGNFPTEAVLDTLLYAVGNVPYRKRPPGTLSKPGVFAGFDYDTLDYRFHRAQGIQIDDLFRYQAVAIYTTQRDATGPSNQLDALRYAAWRQTPNPLSSYVAHGGKVWLFGDGIFYAFLLRPGDTVFGMPRVPQPGSFPYDYMKMRSYVAPGGSSNSNPANYLLSAVPFLPEHATPGRAWPHDTTRVYTRGVCDDPRVGPASARNRARWDGLPCLDMTHEFDDWPSGFLTGVRSVSCVGSPNSILEDLDPTDGVRIGSALDTLYLYRAKDYIGNARPTNPDGKPVMCAYEGIDHGSVVWTAMPIWYFDRQEVRQLTAKVLGSFGLTPQPNPALWTGPGSANPPPDAAALSAEARSSRRVARSR